MSRECSRVGERAPNDKRGRSLKRRRIGDENRNESVIKETKRGQNVEEQKDKGEKGGWRKSVGGEVNLGRVKQTISRDILSRGNTRERTCMCVERTHVQRAGADIN